MIAENYKDANLCLNSIAHTLNKTPNYIGSIYKECTGKSIAQSILEFRLNKAAELILNTDGSIMKIIQTTGFLNESSFYKNFKKHFGFTPNNYKLKQIINAELPNE